MTQTAKYKRIILKLSGESFSPSGERGISMEEVVHISQQISEAQQLGCQIAVVIGAATSFAVVSSRLKMKLFTKRRPTIWG